MLQIVFLVSFKSSRTRPGEMVHGLIFHDVWTSCAKVLEYWMISSLRLKLKRRWNFQRNWNVPLVMCLWCCQKDLDEPKFNGIYLVRFGFRVWEILIFKWFLPLKFFLNSKKTRFWTEKSVEDVVILGPMAEATLVLMIVFNFGWNIYYFESCIQQPQFWTLLYFGRFCNKVPNKEFGLRVTLHYQ
jgi:hypothetical protein